MNSFLLQAVLFAEIHIGYSASKGLKLANLSHQ